MDTKRPTTTEGVEEEMGEIERLPVGCISQVLSLSSPMDTCRSAAASRAFASAAESDSVWKAFLPHNYREILSRASDLDLLITSYRTTRELYFRLCEPLLIDGGRKSFRVERSSGKICLMLSARELAIVWGDSPEYWTWTSLPLSRFKEVAELNGVWWLEITGRIDAAELSRRTAYVAYLVFRLTEGNGWFWRSVPHEASISIGSRSSRESVSLFYEDPSGGIEEDGCPPDVRHVPSSRADGWMEVALGEFLNEEGLEGPVEIYCREIAGFFKRGLILEGIELRPKGGAATYQQQRHCANVQGLTIPLPGTGWNRSRKHPRRRRNLRVDEPEEGEVGMYTRDS